MGMEILGLLDHLESIVLDSAKVPFTKKIMVDEEKLLSVIDKMRMVMQGGSGFTAGRVASKPDGSEPEEAAAAAEDERRPSQEGKAAEIMEQAYKMSKEIREGADKYADEVLANLEATSTRILRTVKAGRERLEKTTQIGSEK
jgi:hypothetical protein